ncbi:MAG: M24 family metallopeptidase, partial [Planctomycetota bacterium]
MATVPASEVETRLERLRALLRRRRIGAAYLVGTASVRYFSGFTGDESALLVTASTCTLITDSRFAEEAEASAPLAEVVQRTDGLATTAGTRLRALGVKAVGVEEDLLTLSAERTLRRAASGLRRKGLDADLRTLRQVKSDWEVRAIRRALRVAEGAFRDTLPFVAPGVREREVAAELEHRMRQRGASGAAFPTIVAAGANASRPHAHPEGRRLRDNTMVLIDWGATVDGYHSDLTRTLFPGTVSPSWRARYEAVLCAQQAAIERIQAGMTGAEADAATARLYIEQAALQGETEAMFQLALAALTGAFEAPDAATAERWLRDAALEGHAAARYLLSRLYLSGRDSVAANREEALHWLRRAHAVGHSDALFALWAHDAVQKGVKEDYTEVRAHYENLAQAGQIEGMHHLGWMYVDGIGIAPERERGIRLLRESATAGSPQSQYRLGRALLLSAENDGQRAEAVTWLEKASNQGVVDAQVLYGDCRKRGIGGPADPAAAAKAFEAASHAGHEIAMTSLGLLYAQGQLSSEPDWKRAARWYRESAELGFAPALFALGNMHFEGQGVTRDPATAVELLSRAARQGYAPAQSNLGTAYREGRGVHRDLEAAVHWFTQAALQGNGPAMFNLSLCHFRGEGTALDQAEGLKWLILAG